MTWNDGYITELGYTFGYYSELNPVRAAAALPGLGQRPPAFRNACELGFGQGLSTVIHAAAQPQTTWWGTDFNPSQAAFARELAQKAGLNAHLFDEAFETFCARPDLPEFDFIALHGIWSWISDANRQVIVDFIGRKLAVGGVLYLSYNTQPGWAAAAPLRHLMKQHSDHMGSPSMGVTKRINDALAFTDELAAVGPAFFRATPQAGEKLNNIKTHARSYLAHEYMNRDWRPMYFQEVADWLEAAKVSFAGPMSTIEQQDTLNMSSDQIAFLTGIADPMFKETVRDFLINQQFRRDFWIRGPRQMSPFEQTSAIRGLRYVLVTPRNDVSTKVPGRQGEVETNPAIYNPILDFLSDQQPRTVAEIERAVAVAGINLPQVNSVVGVLNGLGALAPIQPDDVVKKARPITDRLNAEIMSRAVYTPDIGFLASPVIGGGVPVNRFDQLFLKARREGQKTVADWAKYAALVLGAQGQLLIKNGQTLETPEDNLAELTTLAQALEQFRLPTLKLLGIA